MSAAKPLKAYAPLCVVLCRPETPENIGFVARSMIAYGVNDLRLVGIPRVPEDSKAVFGVWNTFLRTLAVGETIADAMRGLRREKWG